MAGNSEIVEKYKNWLKENGLKEDTIEKLCAEGFDSQQAFDTISDDDIKVFNLDRGQENLLRKALDMRRGPQHVTGQTGGQAGTVNTAGNMTLTVGPSTANFNRDALERKDDKPHQPTTETSFKQKPPGRSPHFGHDDTFVLLLAGAGKNWEVFKRDVKRMETLLTSSIVGIDDRNVFIVLSKPEGRRNTKENIEDKVKDVVYELEKVDNGNFIFYYSGHFSKNHKFCVSDSAADDITDEWLASQFKKIPAKHILLIMDMCYSGSARFETKDGGESPGEDIPQKAAIPRLYEILTNNKKKETQTKSDTKGPCRQPDKVVHWASSLAEEESHCDDYSLFTNAIYQLLTDKEKKMQIQATLPADQKHVSVYDLNEHVVQNVKAVLKNDPNSRNQTPHLKPENPDEEYIRSFPHFASIRKT